MKRNRTQELSVVTLLDILKDLGVTSFMIPLLRPFLRLEMPDSLRMLSLLGDKRLRTLSLKRNMLKFLSLLLTMIKFRILFLILFKKQFQIKTML